MPQIANALSRLPIAGIKINQQGVLNLLPNVDMVLVPRAFQRSFCIDVWNEILNMQLKNFSPLLIAVAFHEHGNAKAIPIHKTGSAADSANHRLISITCICSMHLEHIIYKKLVAYLDEDNLIFPQQHCFKKKNNQPTCPSQ